MKHSARIGTLKTALDTLEVPSFLNDPVRYVRRFESREDAEIGGLIVSAIAYVTRVGCLTS